MADKLLTRKEVAERWQQSKQTIDRYRRLGSLPWIDLSGGSNVRPVVRFALSDIEQYEEKMRMHPISSDNNKAKSQNLSQPLSLSDEGPKLIHRFHASK
ncbi:MAG: helix-turn-helix domain-containing protein [Dehalococcoidia bacterium]|jgi:predicted DNA-binding transcriptional regulator AlpA